MLRKNNPTYRIWQTLKKKAKIDAQIVCKKWLDDFENFQQDMDDRPKSTNYLKRIDDNVMYCKENCIWTDSEFQKAMDFPVEINGITKRAEDWLGEYNKLTQKIIYERYVRNVPSPQVITIPYDHKFKKRKDKLPLEEKRKRQRECAQRSKQKYKENSRETRKIWKNKNREKIKSQRRKLYKDNPKKYREYAVKNRKNGKYKIAARKWYKEKYRNDIGFQLSRKIRARIAHAIKSAKTGKTEKSIILLGEDWNKVSKYLENKFKDKMNWNNIDIDHIRPTSSFDLTDPTQQRKAFHFTNLQPLFSSENSAKYNFWDGSDSHININARLDEAGIVLYPGDFQI